MPLIGLILSLIYKNACVATIDDFWQPLHNTIVTKLQSVEYSFCNYFYQISFVYLMKRKKY